MDASGLPGELLLSRFRSAADLILYKALFDGIFRSFAIVSEKIKVDVKSDGINDCILYNAKTTAIETPIIKIIII